MQDELLLLVRHLEAFGPHAKRPHVDTLKGSKIANLKELRFNADGGVWRAALAFDKNRRSIVLAAASKSGVSSTVFYNRLIRLAETRMAKYEEAQEDE